jgi:hypothetical protein
MLKMKKSEIQLLTDAQRKEIQVAKDKYHPFLGTLLY